MDVWKAWLNIQEKLTQTACENICLAYYNKRRQLHTRTSSYTCTLIGPRKPALLFWTISHSLRPILNHVSPETFTSSFCNIPLSWIPYFQSQQEAWESCQLFHLHASLPFLLTACSVLCPLLTDKRFRFYLNPPILLTFECLSSS